MTLELAALRAGVAAILDEEGHTALARVVEAGDVELTGSEPWTMGSRAVVAHRAALVVDAAPFVLLRRDPKRLDLVRAAFAAAMRTPETELAELAVVLRLPAVARGWHAVYRTAPVREEPERPTREAILAGAAALADARCEPDAAAILRRSELETSESPGERTSIVHCLLRLRPDDLARVRADLRLADTLEAALGDAARRANAAVGAITLGAATAGDAA